MLLYNPFAFDGRAAMLFSIPPKVDDKNSLFPIADPDDVGLPVRNIRPNIVAPPSFALAPGLFALVS